MRNRISGYFSQVQKSRSEIEKLLMKCLGFISHPPHILVKNIFEVSKFSKKNGDFKF